MIDLTSDELRMVMLVEATCRQFQLNLYQAATTASTSRRKSKHDVANMAGKFLQAVVSRGLREAGAILREEGGAEVSRVEFLKKERAQCFGRLRNDWTFAFAASAGRSPYLGRGRFLLF